MNSRGLQARYRPLVKQAWLAYALRHSIDEKDKARQDAWYRQQLMASPCHVYTSKQIRRPEQIDAIFLHFAALAGDEKQIDYWSNAGERRALYRLRITMQKLDVSNDYVNAIAKRMGFLVGFIDDFTELPAEMILKLNAALDMHARRKEHSHA